MIDSVGFYRGIIGYVMASAGPAMAPADAVVEFYATAARAINASKLQNKSKTSKIGLGINVTYFSGIKASSP
jgi:hypothetical protein